MDEPTNTVTGGGLLKEGNLFYYVVGVRATLPKVRGFHPSLQAPIEAVVLADKQMLQVLYQLFGFPPVPQEPPEAVLPLALQVPNSLSPPGAQFA